MSDPPTPDRPPTPDPTKGAPELRERTHYSIEIEITPRIRPICASGSIPSPKRPQDEDLSAFLKRHVPQNAKAPPRLPKDLYSSSLDGIREEDLSFGAAVSSDGSSERSSQCTTSSQRTTNTVDSKGRYIQPEFASMRRIVHFSVNDADIPTRSASTKRNHHKRISAPPVMISASSVGSSTTGVD